jgi:DNA-binding MltR family transcriptional regulator
VNTASQSKRPKRLGYDRLLDEIESGSSRTAVILAAAWIDDLLRAAIVFNFISMSRSDEEYIFTGNGPLATLSSRIRIARAMGIISQKLRSDLDKLRKLRNDYAHSVRDLNLGDEDQGRIIRGLNAVSDTRNDNKPSSNEILRRAVEKIGLYLILRTAPPSSGADKSLSAELRCLDYSNFTEVKMRAHRRSHKIGRE